MHLIPHLSVFTLCTGSIQQENQFLSKLQLSLNLDYGEVYSLQHYVMKFVSDLRQVGGFLPVLPFPPPIKLTTTI